MPTRKSLRYWLPLLLVGLAVHRAHAAELVAFSPSGKALAVAEREDTVRVLDADTRKPKWTQNVFSLTVGAKTTPLKSISALAFAPDGKILAVGGGVLYHGHVAVFDAASGKLLNVVRDVGRSEFVVLAFSPDGKSVCAGARFRPAFVFDATTGERKHKFDTKGLTAVAFSGDGALIATACADEHNTDNIKVDVKIWNAQTGKLVHTLPEARGPVAFSADGKLIAAFQGERSLALWDVGTEKPKRILGD